MKENSDKVFELAKKFIEDVKALGDGDITIILLVDSPDGEGDHDCMIGLKGNDCAAAHLIDGFFHSYPEIQAHYAMHKLGEIFGGEKHPQSGGHDSISNDAVNKKPI